MNLGGGPEILIINPLQHTEYVKLLWPKEINIIRYLNALPTHNNFRSKISCSSNSDRDGQTAGQKQEPDYPCSLVGNASATSV